MLIGAVNNTISQQNLYANRAEDNQKADAIDKAEDVSKTGSQKPSGALNEPRDEYIPSGDKPNETPGIYRMEKDENGQSKIVFDRPDSPEKSEQAAASEKADDKKADMKCTVDTGKVDREIKKLKEEKKQIQQELKNASDDEDKHKDLERRLSQVEAELSAKDNDGYRKQNSTYTNG